MKRMVTESKKRIMPTGFGFEMSPTILIRALTTLGMMTMIAIFHPAQGVQDPRPELYGSWKVVTQPDQWFWKYVFFSHSKFLVADTREYTYRLDTSQNPYHIDLEAKEWDGKISRYSGIYRLRGEALTICIQSAEPVPGIVAPRPSEFVSGGGGGPYLIDLVRVDMAKGELDIYSSSSQNGTAARRTFRDQEGHPLKVIYYGDGEKREIGKSYTVGPAREESLVEREIAIYRYNGDGLATKEEFYDPAMKLLRTLDTEYDSQGRQARSWYSNPSGVKFYEMLYGYERTRTTTHIYFDNTGSYILRMRGAIPKGVDLPHEWGNPVNELVCGIALSKERGALTDIEVWVNIKNTGSSLISLGPMPDPEVIIRNSSGKRIPENLDHQASGKSSHRIMDEAMLGGSVTFVDHSYPLRERFRSLARGNYTIQIQQPVPALRMTLLSNEIAFVID